MTNGCRQLIAPELAFPVCIKRQKFPFIKGGIKFHRPDRMSGFAALFKIRKNTLHGCQEGNFPNTLLIQR